MCGANFHDLVFQQLLNIQGDIVNHSHHAVYYIHRTCNFKLIPTDDINPFYPSWKLFLMQLNWKIFSPREADGIPNISYLLKSRRVILQRETRKKEPTNLTRNVWWQETWTSNVHPHIHRMALYIWKGYVAYPADTMQVGISRWVHYPGLSMWP